ncbi:MAG: hypothetical protein D6790_07340 [Caldilineae bacterium]|nr:MAG: hypothetical protein D6790_07340 [Caldilineae bacterium]
MSHSHDDRTHGDRIGRLLAVLLAVASLGLLPSATGRAAEKEPGHRLIQYDLRVDGMTCPFCVATSEKALKQIPGIRFVHTHLKRGLIHVCAEEGSMPDDAALARLFKERGFTYRSQKKIGACPLDAEGRMREKEER